MDILTFEQALSNRMIATPIGSGLTIFQTIIYTKALTPEDFIKFMQTTSTKDWIIDKLSQGLGIAKYTVITDKGGALFTVVGKTTGASVSILDKLKGFAMRILG